MHTIGVTGGLGSGKTVVCTILKQLGVPVFNADEEAKKLLDREDIKAKILLYFGEKVFRCDRIDKQKLASHVFSNEEALEKLNHLIHPAVAEEFGKWSGRFAGVHPYVVIEAALLIESLQHFRLDRIVLVSCPLETRISRAMKRDSATRESIMARIEKQMPEDQKQKFAHHTIINDDDRMLLPQVLELDKILREIDHEG